MNIMEENLPSKQIIENADPINLRSGESNAFDMDFLHQRPIAVDNIFYRETNQAWKPSPLSPLMTLIKELIRRKTHHSSRLDHLLLDFTKYSI